MATKVIKKEDIPEWDKGNVTIKTLNFGEKLLLADLKAKVKQDGMEIADETISIKDVSIIGLAAGIHTMMNAEETAFIIREGLNLELKKEIVFQFEFEAGQYLLQQISELNKPISKEEKKN